jgi:hypothetical protein
MVGSANFTTSGIQNRTEMSVFFENVPQVEELAKWFDKVWADSLDVPVDALHELIESMPEAQADTISQVIGHNPLAIRCVHRAELVPLNEKVTVSDELKILTYNVANRLAKGCDIDGTRFRVMKGSIARGRTTPKFRKYNNGNFDELRDNLIERGVLARKYEWEDYTFTVNCDFDSPSEAASIVAGMPRSLSPKEWRP